MSAGVHSANRAALVTGASRGIGRGIAVELAALGFDLLLNYRSNAKAAREARTACLERAESAGKQIEVRLHEADISNAEGRSGLLTSAKDAFGRLDLLVNNAGVAPSTRADLLEASEESFDRLIAINLKGPFFLTQFAARWMLELREQLGTAYRGKIVTISSISAYTASVNRGDYCISKAGLSMLTPLFAARLASAGIQVFEIRPGIIATDMTAGVKQKYDDLIAGGLTPMPRWGEPEDVGKAVAAIASEAFPFSTGEVINIDGGFHLRQL
jgi:NAD(P)-dependent dehydrogenase (short-subunit alcohol dehydrogenase family)